MKAWGKSGVFRIIYEFTEDGIARVDYEETQAYRVTQRFLRVPREMVRRLLAED